MSCHIAVTSDEQRRAVTSDEQDRAVTSDEQRRAVTSDEQHRAVHQTSSTVPYIRRAAPCRTSDEQRRVVACPEAQRPSVVQLSDPCMGVRTSQGVPQSGAVGDGVDTGRRQR